MSIMKIVVGGIGASNADQIVLRNKLAICIIAEVLEDTVEVISVSPESL